MNVEVFLHGVPYGNDFYGTGVDRNYFNNLYSNEAADNKMLVEVNASADGKRYIYYHYLVGKNVVDSDGRSGSYFGISLRFDCYCVNYANVYRILDSVYNLYCCGSLLAVTESGVRYKVSGFKQAEGKIKEIERKVMEMLQDGFSGNDFIGIDRSFASEKKRSGNEVESL